MNEITPPRVTQYWASKQLLHAVSEPNRQFYIPVYNQHDADALVTYWRDKAVEMARVVVKWGRWEGDDVWKQAQAILDTEG